MTETNERRADWEQRYEQGRTHWDRGEASAALRAWLAVGAMPKGRVLVPGCGNGHEVVELVRYGCDVTAVDIADQPVARLREQLAAEGLEAHVVQADLLSWRPEQPFAAIYEQTCLCALDPLHWKAYELRLATWLEPGAPLFALFMQTGAEGGPPFDCPIERMRELFEDVRWQWPDEFGRIPHPAGFHEEAAMLVRRAEGR
ncbi:MAG: methyltransferase domain-containing protein [Planctomycetota bacterium]